MRLSYEHLDLWVLLKGKGDFLKIMKTNERIIK